MHRAKKIAITATAVVLLSATGMSSALAERPDHDHDKITICHRTFSDKHPYVKIEISENAREAHENHPNPPGRPDIFDLEPGEDCPGPTSPPPPPPPGGGDDEDGDDCIASSSSGDSTQSQSGLINVGNINLGLNNLLGNLLCQSNVGNGLGIAVIGDALGGFVGDDDSGDGTCLAEDISGDSEQEQEGLVNVGNLNLGLNNLAGNALCQSNVLNGGAVSVLGTAVGGDLFGDDDSDGDCIASSESGNSEQEQEGAINVGNINVGGNNLLGNALCQSDVLNGLAVSVLGTAVGTGGGLMSSGPLGLLSGVGYLVPGIMSDVTVVAGLLVSL